jgi:hypothetical protein
LNSKLQPNTAICVFNVSWEKFALLFSDKVATRSLANPRGYPALFVVMHTVAATALAYALWRLPALPPGGPVWRTAFAPGTLPADVLYIDGSVKASAMGTGWVHLHCGQLQATGSARVPVERSRDSTFAEAYAWLYALQTVGEALQCQDVLLLTDSFELVRHWAHFVEGEVPRYSVFPQILQYCSELASLTVRAVGRQDNVLANGLARRALGLSA